jgi:hypothetical protein
MRVISGIVGVLLLLITATSVLRTLVLPRGHNPALIKLLWEPWRGVLRTLARFTSDYEVRDHILAWLGPLVLVTMLIGWLGGMLLGYGLVMHAISGLSAAASFREAGSSLFTLGYASSDRLHLSAIDFAAAASGPLVIALQISYLPTLYAAYNRRETDVTMLLSRAGEPAWGPELLARQQLVGTVDQLRQVYQGWERLAADIGESHANYRVLLTFRSPQPYRNWLVAMLAVMDGAALHLALSPSTAIPEARLALRASFTALREIARTIGIQFDPDPRPDAPVALTYEDFLEGVKRVADTGFPCERSPEEAWPDFRGWRVNYEAVAYELARRIDAVPAKWSGPRDWDVEPMNPIRPPHRQPDSPDEEFPDSTAPP